MIKVYQFMGISIEQIQALRQHHTGRLLLRAYRAFQERAYDRLRARGHEGLSITHTGMLAHLDIEGTHIKTLAERAGVSKQAMGQLVSDLEAKGYVSCATDPADRRATLVYFTDTGREFLEDAYHVKREIEAEYTALLGEDRMADLMDMLEILSNSGGAA
jgi:DNA-binding MarR family transcriptional regulator